MTSPPRSVVTSIAADVNPDVTFMPSGPQMHLPMMPPLADHELACGPSTVVTHGDATPPEGSPEPQPVVVALEDLPEAIAVEPEEASGA